MMTIKRSNGVAEELMEKVIEQYPPQMILDSVLVDKFRQDSNDDIVERFFAKPWERAFWPEGMIAFYPNVGSGIFGAVSSGTWSADVMIKEDAIRVDVHMNEISVEKSAKGKFDVSNNSYTISCHLLPANETSNPEDIVTNRSFQMALEVWDDDAKDGENVFAWSELKELYKLAA